MEVGADAHQTSFVVSVFADYLHQQVMFLLSFFQLTDKRQFHSPVQWHVESFKKAHKSTLGMQRTSLPLANQSGCISQVKSLPPWRVCCDAGATTRREVCPPAASAAATSAPGRGGKREGAATRPGAEGGAHFPWLSLEKQRKHNQHSNYRDEITKKRKLDRKQMLMTVSMSRGAKMLSCTEQVRHIFLSWIFVLVPFGGHLHRSFTLIFPIASGQYGLLALNPNRIIADIISTPDK